LDILRKKEQEKKLAEIDEDNLFSLKEKIQSLNENIKQLQNNKIEVQRLEHKFKILKDLEKIFSKELVIHVFKDFL
jgi:prefoldin subunit 5